MVSQETRVLLLTGDRSLAELVDECLGPPVGGFSLVTVDSMADAKEHLEAGAADLALCDLTLWGGQGLDSIGRLRSAGTRIPVIALTSGEDTGVEDVTPVQRGAQDSLHRASLQPRVLTHAIHLAIERHRMMERIGLYARQARQAEAQLRNVIFRNVDTIVVVDRHGVIRFANPAAEVLFGRTMRELEGMTFEFPTPADRSAEIEVLRPDGALRLGEMTEASIDWEGHPARVISIRDVTRRRVSGVYFRGGDEEIWGGPLSGRTDRSAEDMLVDQARQSLEQVARSQPGLLRVASLSVQQLQQRLQRIIRSSQRLAALNPNPDAQGERQEHIARIVSDSRRVHELLELLLPSDGTRKIQSSGNRVRPRRGTDSE